MRVARLRILIALALCLMGVTATPATSTAAAAPGPTWWRISDGGKSVLWILGAPDGMLTRAKWSDASLRLRMGRAKQFFSPTIGKVGAVGNGVTQRTFSVPTRFEALQPNSGIGWLVLLMNGIGNADRPQAQSVDDRLPPDLAARVHKLIDPYRLADGEHGLPHAKTMELALLLDLWNWPKGELSSPVVDTAGDIAKRAKIPIRNIAVQNLWFPLFQDMALPPTEFQPNRYGANGPSTGWPVETVAFEPPEALQQKCLRDVLDDTDSGAMPGLRQAGMEAWARGDVEHALKRSSTVKYCLMGTLPSTDVKAFLDRQAATYERALDYTFDEPGESVALVEFDPLLMPDGVLDHYRRLGYTITTSDGMGS